MIQEILAIVGFVTVIVGVIVFIGYILKVIKDAFEDYWYDRMWIQKGKHETSLRKQNSYLHDTVMELTTEIRHTRMDLEVCRRKLEEK